MEDMILKVPCPCCIEEDGESADTLVLLGDDQQNMQCLGCGYGSNNNMKEHISDNPFPQEFKDVCKKLNDRFWAPSVFTTANYNVKPTIKDKKLNWIITPIIDTTTEVLVPTFADAFKMVEKLEGLIEHKIQQSQDN
jgi:hypothetical protein|tara:strand:- start:400 stop:810 length:411 start_codon:yes stop_codon:yes gene_type:complete